MKRWMSGFGRLKLRLKRKGDDMRAVERIVVIGCGGIGSWLLGPLLRFLNAERFAGEVHLWDGDRYTPENQERQEFAVGSIGENKAEVQAGAFRTNYPALRIDPNTAALERRWEEFLTDRGEKDFPPLIFNRR
ncbi:MAG: ThiF family adenylyltransferase [Planctomycetota bacterium]|nr:ThiF family adenylyltransferase [Planctomycetota bacterium]